MTDDDFLETALADLKPRPLSDVVAARIAQRLAHSQRHRLIFWIASSGAAAILAALALICLQPDNRGSLPPDRPQLASVPPDASPSALPRRPTWLDVQIAINESPQALDRLLDNCAFSWPSLPDNPPNL